MIRPGSGIAVVAPAGPVHQDLYRAGLDILAARYRIVHDEVSAQEPGDLPYLAGDDGQRLGALNRALADPDVGAVIFARGGYGCTRLLPQLDPGLLVRRPLLVGFSDITAIHAWVACALPDLPTVHGPVVTQLSRLPAEDVLGLFHLLEGQPPPVLRGLEPLRGGRARGRLFGGNLTLVSHLCGTPYLPDPAGRLLLLEEVNEAPYRVDRMLTQLRLCGVLGRVAGVVVGSLSGCEDSQRQAGTARAVLEDRLGSLGIPVALGAPVGHGDRNLALPLGVEAELDADRGELRFLPGSE